MEEEIAMSKQSEIPGFESVKNPDIERAIDAWLEAKVEQKRAAETTKLRHSALLIQMGNAGIEAYQFIEPGSGRKKLLVVARDPKAKTTKAPRFNRRDQDVEDETGDELVVEDILTDDGKVESRRVRRTAEHDKAADPFGSTRKSLIDEAEQKRADDAPLTATISETAKAKGKKNGATEGAQ